MHKIKKENSFFTFPQRVAPSGNPVNHWNEAESGPQVIHKLHGCYSQLEAQLRRRNTLACG